MDNSGRPSARAITRLSIQRKKETGRKDEGGAACYQRMKYGGLACQPTEFYLTVFYVESDWSARRNKQETRGIDATIESVDLGGVTSTSKESNHPLSRGGKMRGEQKMNR